MKTIGLLFMAVFLGSGLTLRADLLCDLNPLNVNAPVGSNACAITTSGYCITAYGYFISYVTGKTNPTGLYWIYGGGDKQSLGIAGNIDRTGDHELSLTNFGSANHVATFIQVDMDSLNHTFSNCEVRVGSVSNGEEFDVYGSHVLGMLGTKIISNDADDDTFVTIPHNAWTNYQYFAVAVSPQNSDYLCHQCDNVLMDSILLVGQIPEPSSLMLLAGSMSVALGWRLWRRPHSA